MVCQQLRNKWNDFYGNVVIHSKTTVGVSMKNSSLVDSLSRHNRSERKAKSSYRELWLVLVTNYVYKMMWKPIEKEEIRTTVNQSIAPLSTALPKHVTCDCGYCLIAHFSLP